MTVTVTLTLPVNVEKLEAFKTFFQQELPKTREFEGCHFVETYEDQDKPGYILLFERWESKEHQEKYMAWRAETGMMDILGEYLVGPPVVAFYDKRDI